MIQVEKAGGAGKCGKIVIFLSDGSYVLLGKRPLKEDEVISNVCGTVGTKAPTGRQHSRFN